MKKIALKTFGCKINQYESTCITDDFVKAGFKKVKFSELADVYIINTCTVTNRTDYKARNAIKKVLKKKVDNPSIILIVTGCYAQRNPDKIEKMGDIDLIVDNNKKNKIIDFILSKDKTHKTFENILNLKKFSEQSTDSLFGKSRAFVKIQDGCDFYCAYCAIPYARGHSRSRKKEHILRQIKDLTRKGYKEFVLAGINLGLYGKDNTDGYFLSNLLYDIEKITAVKQIRLSSIEPQLFDNDLLDFFKHSKKICPHFHIPLQAGNDTILNKMKRRYTTADFEKVINKLRAVFPHCAIGLDVISGFPSESDELFEKTYNFIQQLNIQYLHAFSYSKRPGTAAEKMKNHINGNIISSRTNKLIDLSNQKTEEYIKKLIDNNITLNGIVEKKDGAYWTALSDHYIRIYFKTKSELDLDRLSFKPKSPFKDGIKVALID